MLKVRHNPWDEGGLCPDTDCCEAEDTDRRCAAKVRIHTMAEESRIQRVLKWSSLKDGQEKRVWTGRCGSCNRCLCSLHMKGIGFHLIRNVESVCWMNTWMNLMLHQDKSILICFCRHLMTQWVNISCGADWMILYTPQVSNISPNQIHLWLPDNYLRITPFPQLPNKCTFKQNGRNKQHCIKFSLTWKWEKKDLSRWIEQSFFESDVWGYGSLF